MGRIATRLMANGFLLILSTTVALAGLETFARWREARQPPGLSTRLWYELIDGLPQRDALIRDERSYSEFFRYEDYFLIGPGRFHSETLNFDQYGGSLRVRPSGSRTSSSGCWVDRR